MKKHDLLFSAIRFLSRYVFCALLILLCTYRVQAQSCNGSIVAGGNGYGSADNQFSNPQSLAVDAAGFIYVADRNRIQKFPPNSTSATSGSTVAGTGVSGAAANQISFAEGIAIDAAGYIYVADTYNYRIQKFPPNSTSATNGTTVAGGNGQGNATNQFYNPTHIAVDAAGFIYVSDRSNARVLKFPPASTSATSGTIVAGNGFGLIDDLSKLIYPTGIAVDAAGFIYVANDNSNRVLKFPPNSTSATSGTIVAGGNGQGNATNQLTLPYAIVLDAAGYLYVSDTYRHRVLKFPPNSTSATSGTIVAGGNGQGTASNQASSPQGIAVDAAGYIYVAESNNFRVKKFAPSIGVASIQQLAIDNSACPVRLRGQATGSRFEFTGPNGYVFSEVYRQAGSYQPIATNIRAAGTYQLKVVSTNDCGTSTPVTQTVTVNQACP